LDLVANLKPFSLQRLGELGVDVMELQSNYDFKKQDMSSSAR
jgi:hypothetical protein